MPHRMKPPPTQVDPPADEELVDRARAGDRGALDLLVERHSPRVYGVALRLVGDREAAEEVLQDTFLHVIERLDTFRGEARFSTWLFRIATNAALARRRTRRREEAVSLEACLPTYDETGRMARLDLDYGRAARAEEVLERAELAGKAREALAGLPEAYRDAFVLRDLEELSTAETAEVLGVGVDVVRQRVHRARLMLRGYLGRITGGEA
jgi:RNA polymerase sigma-70 factor, ECF subfamily